MALADTERPSPMRLADWRTSRSTTPPSAATAAAGAGLRGVRSPLVTYAHRGRRQPAGLGLVHLGELLLAAGHRAASLGGGGTGGPPARRDGWLVGPGDPGPRQPHDRAPHSSIRMGENRARTGADSFGRVWGYRNRVNDVASSPTPPASTPRRRSWPSRPATATTSWTSRERQALPGDVPYRRPATPPWVRDRRAPRLAGPEPGPRAGGERERVRCSRRRRPGLAAGADLARGRGGGGRRARPGHRRPAVRRRADAAVFHAAAVHPTRSTREFFDVNVGGTQNVARPGAAVARFVHVSSNSPPGQRLARRGVHRGPRPTPTWATACPSTRPSSWSSGRTTGATCPPSWCGRRGSTALPAAPPEPVLPHHPPRPVPADGDSAARWPTPTTWSRACCGPRWPTRRPATRTGWPTPALRAARDPGHRCARRWRPRACPPPGRHAAAARAAQPAWPSSWTAGPGPGRYPAPARAGRAEPHHRLRRLPARPSGYEPTVELEEGMRASIRWCLEHGEQL